MDNRLTIWGGGGGGGGETKAWIWLIMITIVDRNGQKASLTQHFLAKNSFLRFKYKKRICISCRLIEN